MLGWAWPSRDTSCDDVSCTRHVRAPPIFTCHDGLRRQTHRRNLTGDTLLLERFGRSGCLARSGTPHQVRRATARSSRRASKAVEAERVPRRVTSENDPFVMLLSEPLTELAYVP